MIDKERSVHNFIPEEIQKVLPRQIPVFLVGGAVRDALLGRQVVDLDFVLPKQVLKTARLVANALKGDFYVLDGKREIGRVILVKAQGERQILDFALQRGPTLEADLGRRDFTINAMAVNIHDPAQLIDPLGGCCDLHDKVLRVCCDSSIRDDPVRILRAIRMASAFQLRLQPETLSLIRQAVDQLNRVSVERIRDEIYRLLDISGRASSIWMLDMLGVIKIIFPELALLKNIKSAGDPTKSKWDHTLDVLVRLENLFTVLAIEPDQDSGNNLMMGLVNLKLGRYREQLDKHLNTRLNSGRSIRQTVFLATLFHQIGKIGTLIDDDTESVGTIRGCIYNMTTRLQALCLSNQEIDHIIKITVNYLPPKLPANPEKLPDRRDIYRFFNRTGEAGIDAGLLFLANKLADGGLDLSPEVFAHQLGVVRTLYEAWWENKENMISPTLFVNGDDLMKMLDLAPGPQIGKLLSIIKEAQAVGEVNSREEAISFVQSLLERK